MNKVQTLAHIEHSVNYSIFDVKWIPFSAKFISIGSKTNGNGIFQIYELDSPKVKLVKEVTQESSLKCSSFGISSPGERHLAVGDFSGKLQIFDIERPEKSIYKVDAHSDIINSIDAVGGNSTFYGAKEIVTGSRDGSVKIWDPRQKNDPVANISAKSANDTELRDVRDCWAVGFGDSFNNTERAVCSGYDNGDIKLFDLRKMSLRWETTCKNGICSIEFDRKDIQMNKLAVTTLEGGLYVYDMRTQHPKKGFSHCSEKNAGQSLGSNGVITGAKSTVWVVKHLPQNRDIFVTGGGAGSIRIWNYKYPDQRYYEMSDGTKSGIAGNLEMISATTISQQPIHCFDWCAERLGLAVCGAFDQTVRVLISTNLNLF
ncbi:CLUMA_CG003987, isoform A [Clunio marinus]|uniref:CLUMA_CG003987, isoform A n=1 Tax=Clunio marinus TaxID=568069 RepID=A0A1J1HQP2_9DIPT|nr:CLUMA_CG003987, isoform A [Clunio marinus]